MAESPVLLVWVEDGGGRQEDFLVPDDDLDVGVVIVPPGSQGPAPGRYVRLSDERSALVTPRQPRPVLLRNTHTSSEKSWVAPFDDPEQEVAVADRVRRKVQEAVELEIADGAVPIGPTTTYVTEDPAGGFRIHGVCVVAREATAP